MRVATFGKVSVVMIALAASSQAWASACFSQAASTASNFAASSGSPMTPVEAMKTCGRGSPPPRRRVGGQLAGLRALLAGEGVGVAGIHHERPRRALARFLRHQSTGAEGHFERVNTPATAVSLARVT